MFGSFRLSMTWLHTWFGLVFGFVLMVVFFFGSLSVFDREIDRWAIPETRFEPQKMPSYDRMLAPIFAGIEPDEDELEAARERVDAELPATLKVIGWSAYTTHRDPVLALFSEFAVPNNPDDPRDHVHGYLTIDPRSGAVVPETQLKIGSEFFYPMHFSLHLIWMDLGYWIVGLAALVMLVALVSGVAIHRKIFREFFTFRAGKQPQRATLDLHNLTGVVALPFHFMFALSGLIIFAGIYLPVSETMLEPLAEAQDRLDSARTGLPLDPAGVPAPLASVDAMVAEAQRRWAARGVAGEVGFLSVTHLGDSNGYVSVYRAGTDRLAVTGEAIHFKAATGELLYEDPPRAVVAGIADFVTGLHLQQFRHWLLRALYFIGGMAGCICIATGLVFFVGKRKLQHARQGQNGARCIDALAIGAVTGPAIAALAMLVGNRALPADLPLRGDWQEAVFWGAWVLALLHAGWRTAPVRQARLAPAWPEQCWAIALLAVAAVVLNWLTSGDHLLKTISMGYWPVAGVDLVLLASAMIAVGSALALRRRVAVTALAAESDRASQDRVQPGGARA